MPSGNNPTAMNMTRSTEWLLTCALLAWGANMLRPESFFDQPVYTIMNDLMSETRWGMCTVIVAVLRGVGLAINGWWRRTPVIRFIGAWVGGLCWLAIGFLMLASSYSLNTRLPAGFFWYPIFFTFEGWCVLACGYDMFKNGSLSAGVSQRHVS
ncbi:hypothetical protein [Methylobacterium sp. Leaf108]|uniref:hypothetical protein n=1 Tax=Methylobacterium sp. Leaf108 TaxID=1736256 RepID=UPI0006F78F6C|nr:hypothetical protein [Methylobacterium sp. Leaf108]KQP61045.1 hypothetical protein ASF39_15325 [Methylobacterium sp. Leaf108]